MRDVNDTARLHTTRNGFQNTAERPQTVTQTELEAAGQQRLRFRPFSAEEERSAVDWWASRILDAEISTGNAEASQRPAQYLQTVKSRVRQKEDVLLGVVEEWQKAKATGTLDEPVWSEAIKPPKFRIMAAPAARAVAG